MQREIKFRGKREDNGDWVFGSFIPDALEGSNSDLISWGFIRRYNSGIGKMETIEVDRETVGQYTGLKDKNGVEIFEGDIVKYHPEANAGIGRVEYHGSGFYVGDEFNGLLDDFATIGIEVISNIHDNPELLGSTP